MAPTAGVTTAGVAEAAGDAAGDGVSGTMFGVSDGISVGDSVAVGAVASVSVGGGDVGVGVMVRRGVLVILGVSEGVDVGTSV